MGPWTLRDILAQSLGGLGLGGSGLPFGASALEFREKAIIKIQDSSGRLQYVIGPKETEQVLVVYCGMISRAG